MVLKYPRPLSPPINSTSGFASIIATVEQIFLHFNEDYGLNSVCLRFQKASGVDEPYKQSSLYKKNNSDLVAILEACQSGNDTPYKVFSGEVETEEGSATRDYLHVLDVCDAHIKAMEYLLKDNQGAYIYNIGGEQSHTTDQLLEMAKTITGNEPNIERVESATGPSEQTLSSQWAKRHLNWSSNYSVNNIMTALWHEMQQYDNQAINDDDPTDYSIRNDMNDESVV
jgi:UDP-glucose 4-epimerase